MYLVLAAICVLALSYLVVTVRGSLAGGGDLTAGTTTSGPPRTGEAAPGGSATAEPSASSSASATPDATPSPSGPATSTGQPATGSPPTDRPSSGGPSTPANPPAPSHGFPTAATTGVPVGWQPREVRNSWRISQSGTYEDVRVTGGDITIAAANVTIRRVELVGGRIYIENCRPGAIIEDVSFLPPAGRATGGSPDGAIVPGGYTARRVKIQNRIEGLRSGGCGPVVAEDSYIHINDGGDCELHADGIQGYNGDGLIVRNVAIDARQMDCGTAPIFYPKRQGNSAPVEIDGLWLAGGGYALRVGVGPANLNRVYILDRSWGYGPVNADCDVIALWDVSVVDSGGKVLRRASCTGEGN